MHAHAEPALPTAPLTADRTPSRLLTRLRLSRATAAALAMLLSPLCEEPEPRPEPEGQTLRPVGPRGQA